MHNYTRTTLFIDGQWVPPRGSGAIEVIDPSTEQPIGSVPHCSQADVDTAVAAARRAFDPLISVAERRDRVAAVIAAMEKRLPDIAETITTEMGAPVRIAQSVQTQVPLAVARGFAAVLDSFEFEERVGNSLVVREPYGVVGAITPWNYPLYQVIAKVLPAIAAGCTVVLKPSNEAPLSVFEFIEAVDEAGLPAGVVNLVSGPGRVIGERLAEHPDVDFVSFTGSTSVGARVAELAGRSVKKVAVELGGKSANVILDDADLGTAVKVGVGNAFLNGGQTCMAWTRMLVPQSSYGEALDLIEAAVARYTVGDPWDPGTRIGPSASASQYQTVRGFIERAQRDGARLLTGGAEKVRDVGYYVAPTVFADVDPASELGQEEVFGPVLAVIPFADEDEALRIANGTPYGLSGAVWAGDVEHAVAFARGVQTGQLDINGGMYNPIAPFGGYKKSGIGRELGRAGFEEYLQTKSLQLPEPV
jgi:aldehyde dehydrogenase (NAD+)